MRMPTRSSGTTSPFTAIRIASPVGKATSTSMRSTTTRSPSRGRSRCSPCGRAFRIASAGSTSAPESSAGSAKGGCTEDAEPPAVTTGAPLPRDSERAAVVPGGISKRFRPTEPDPDWLDRRFGIRWPYLLAMGAADPRKNVATARRAAGDRQLVVVGPGGIGHVTDDELVALYSGADCFLFLSLDEGFGFPPLEAMACGCPVLASARGSLPEVLGDSALLVEPDADEAAAALARVLEDDALRADLRAKGLARACELTWEACARATAAVYRTAAGDAGRET